MGDFAKTEASLSWDETRKEWDGYYQRGEFSGQVTLKRPKNTTSSLFVGTWFDSNRSGNNRVHMAQQSDGGYTAWADDVFIPGRMRYANGIQPPQQSTEHYGQIAKAKIVSPGLILVELRAYISGCCSHPFTALISSDGSKLIGDWSLGAKQAGRTDEWKRMPGNSCVAAASEPPLEPHLVMPSCAVP